MLRDHSLFVELETTLIHGSDSQRFTILRRMTDLFLAGKDIYTDEHVAVFDGVTLEDDVFVGSNVAFINDRYPRSHRDDAWTLEKTVIRKGTTYVEDPRAVQSEWSRAEGKRLLVVKRICLACAPTSLARPVKKATARRITSSSYVGVSAPP